jgi:AcrR family transcriptional regulator
MVDKAAEKKQAATAEPRGYHHGDLPETLMDAAVRHVAAEGTEKLSLRALARECGVSATAPYRHFPSKRCLLAAIATRGFMQLRSHCEQHLDRSASLEEQVLALGRAYVEFAVANPTTYQLMFGSVIEDFSEYEMLANAADESYALVLSVLDEVCKAHPELGMDAVTLGGIVWSGVHGLASLRQFHMARANVEDDRATFQSLRSLAEDSDRALRILMGGFLP